MSTIQKYEKSEPSTLDLHSACRLGDLALICEAYKRSPDKLNTKDAGVIKT
jgi:hypothetical protein